MAASILFSRRSSAWALANPVSALPAVSAAIPAPTSASAPRSRWGRTESTTWRVSAAGARPRAARRTEAATIIQMAPRARGTNGRRNEITAARGLLRRANVGAGWNSSATPVKQRSSSPAGTHLRPAAGSTTTTPVGLQRSSTTKWLAFQCSTAGGRNERNPAGERLSGRTSRPAARLARASVAAVAPSRPRLMPSRAWRTVVWRPKCVRTMARQAAPHSTPLFANCTRTRRRSRGLVSTLACAMTCPSPPYGSPAAGRGGSASSTEGTAAGSAKRSRW